MLDCEAVMTDDGASDEKFRTQFADLEAKFADDPEFLARLKAICTAIRADLMGHQQAPKLYKKGEGVTDLLWDYVGVPHDAPLAPQEQFTAAAVERRIAMTNVIQLKPQDSEDFTGLLREALDRLEVARDALIEDITHLSLLGPWAKWSDEQPAGAIMSFDREVLRSTGDERINRLCDLCDALHRTLESLAQHR